MLLEFKKKEPGSIRGLSEGARTWRTWIDVSNQKRLSDTQNVPVTASHSGSPPVHSHHSE